MKELCMTDIILAAGIMMVPPGDSDCKVKILEKISSIEEAR